EFSQRAGERKRHLRVVLVDDRRSRVFADVETLIERELSNGSSVFDAAFPHQLSVDREGSLAALANTAAVVGEIKGNDVYARRERLTTCDAGLVVSLFWVLGTVLIRVSVDEHRRSVEHQQTPAPEASPLSPQDTLGSTFRNLHVGGDPKR